MLSERGPRAPENPVQAHYSNINYILAGMVIQAVTGNGPASEINNRIFRPLGLRNTGFPTSDPGLHGNFMYGYAYMGMWPFISLNERSTSNVQIFWTAGAIVSTLDDLNTFYRALFTGRLLPAAQMSELKTTVPFPDNNPTSSYGLGIIRGRPHLRRRPPGADLGAHGRRHRLFQLRDVQRGRQQADPDGRQREPPAAGHSGRGGPQQRRGHDVLRHVTRPEQGGRPTRRRAEGAEQPRSASKQR
ncbi:serine hydrolase domain-containing protein [Streptomyces sp. NPDC001717]|uniref:serine hydrolase domain-containing protein n=1 Tax=Streptomyces sp. NPDC001717 TaxID=3364604 RepID=UPI0036D12D58